MLHIVTSAPKMGKFWMLPIIISAHESVKTSRQDGMGVESVSVTGALSHNDTLEISCHSPTRVLLPALESMESKRIAIEAIQ